MPSPSTLWIVHREAPQRAALSRIAAAGENTLLGAPGDDLFESAGAADLIVLGLSGDFETELEFAHRVGSRQPDCPWILLAETGAKLEVERLFDTVQAEVLAFPPSPGALRRAMRRALEQRRADPLSRRRSRDLLAARFARWFSDLDFPDLLRALDPRLASAPLWIQGEPGTGRGLVARYVHTFGGDPNDRFIRLSCEGVRSAEDLLGQIEDGSQRDREDRWTLWLEDVHALPLPLQREVQDWVEFGLPEGRQRTQALRWIASASEDSTIDLHGAVDPRLLQALSGIALRIPPLRERSDAIESFVRDTTLAWCSARSSRVRTFGEDAVEALRAHPWPYNTLELESVVLRSLALSSADPVPAAHLRFQTEGLLPSVEPEVVADLHDGDAEAEPAQVIETLATPRASWRSSPETPLPKRPPQAQSVPQDDPDSASPAWRKLVGAVAHEVRNPLVSIRTFAELLPEHHDDAEFRARFSELVDEDVRRIEQVVARLQDLAEPASTERKPVDVSALLDNLLEEHRDVIQDRRLLVLKELDRSTPFALANEALLRSALDGLLSKALHLAPQRGDVYLASHRQVGSGHQEPTLRVLLRYHGEPRGGAVESHETTPVEGVSVAETTLEFVAAETAIRAMGGTLAVDTTQAQGSVVVIDLPAPR